MHVQVLILSNVPAGPSHTPFIGAHEHPGQGHHHPLEQKQSFTAPRQERTERTCPQITHLPHDSSCCTNIVRAISVLRTGQG